MNLLERHFGPKTLAITGLPHVLLMPITLVLVDAEHLLHNHPANFLGYRCCSESQRNSIQLQPGIVFTFLGIATLQVPLNSSDELSGSARFQGCVSSRQPRKNAAKLLINDG